MFKFIEKVYKIYNKKWTKNLKVFFKKYIKWEKNISFSNHFIFLKKINLIKTINRKKFFESQLKIDLNKNAKAKINKELCNPKLPFLSSPLFSLV